MENKSINPFAAGNHVTGDSFIGRSKELSMLWQRAVIKRAFTQIVGLPRMGKSSLVKQCFEIREKELRQDYKTIYIYKEGAESTLLKFWQLRARQINREVQKTADITSDQKNTLRDKYESLDSTDYDSFHQDFCEYLSEIKELTGYWILFALDEFDDYPALCKSDYIKIDELCSSFCTIVTISHRPVKILEEEIYGRAYLYSRHLKPYYIGVYSEEDWNLYWEKYRPKLPLNDTQFEEYKQMVYDYVGYLPFLIDHLNEEAFPWGLENFEKIHMDLEYQLRVSIKEDIMRDQIGYIKEYRLEDAAKTLLIGSDANNFMDDAILLKNYGFLNYIPSLQKEQLFGYQVGPRFEGAQMAYTCFSDLATILFYEMCTEKLPYADKLQNTELALRGIVKYYLKEKYGNNCFDSDLAYPDKEIWEDLMRNDLQNQNNGANLVAIFNRNIDGDTGVRHSKANQIRFELQDPSMIDNRCLIDFCTLGQLEYIFFRNCWNWFKNVFHVPNKWNWLGEQQNGDYYLVNKLRNSKDHLQMDYVSGVRIEECIEACDRVCSCIDDYLKQHS